MDKMAIGPTAVYYELALRSRRAKRGIEAWGFNDTMKPRYVWEHYILSACAVGTISVCGTSSSGHIRWLLCLRLTGYLLRVGVFPVRDTIQTPKKNCLAL